MTASTSWELTSANAALVSAPHAAPRQRATTQRSTNFGNTNRPHSENTASNGGSDEGVTSRDRIKTFHENYHRSRNYRQADIAVIPTSASTRPITYYEIK
jgi:hypothetical protein